MLISLRSISYEDLKKQLSKDDKIVLWSCDTCIRFSGMGGIDNLEILENMLTNDGFKVIKKELIGVSCVDELIEDRRIDQDKKNIFEEATAIIVVACEEGWERVEAGFKDKKVIKVTRTFGFGNISDKRGVLLTNPFEDLDIEPTVKGIPIKEIAKKTGTYDTFFDADLKNLKDKSKKVKIIVDGKRIEAKEGANLLETCENNGFKIPHLCYRKGLNPAGACRLCLVKIKGRSGLIPSCCTEVQDKMEVITEDNELREYRRMTLELLLAAHEHNCLYCVKDGKCELSKVSKEYQIEKSRFPSTPEVVSVDQSSGAIVRDPNKCILCGRCVRACDEIAGKHNLTFTNRGNKVVLSAGLDKPMGDTDCATCMACVYACPTGALYEKMLYFDGADWKPRKLYGSYYSECKSSEG
jgi:ferredoxin